MTRGAKIGLAAAGALVLLGSGLIGGVAYLVREINEGTRFSKLGYENVRKHQYNEAVANLTAATKHVLFETNRYWVYVNRAFAQKHLKRDEAAMADLNEAIRLRPKAAASYEDRGLIYETLKQNAKALSDFDRAISLEPNRGMAHLHRGTILYDDGEFEKAQADFTEACRIWPNRAHAFVMLGRCYLSLDDLDRALASFETAVRLFPGSREARERRSEIYRKQGESERAFLDLAKASFRSARPRYPVPSAPLPGSLGGSARLQVQPLPSLQTAPSSSPAGFAVVMRQAMEAGNARDYQRAVELYNTVLKSSISAEQACVATSSRGLCYLALGDVKRAEADFDEAIKLNPNSADAYARRGFGLTQKGEYEDALKDYEEAIRLNPEQYVTLCDRGQAFAKLGDYKSALADFERAIELEPTDAKAFLDRGDAYFRQKDFDRASGDALMVIGFQPDSVRARIDLIRAYAAGGNTEDAERELGRLKNVAVTDEGEMRNAVAWFRATWPDDKLRNGAEALAEARRACELTSWKSVATLDTLAAAEAEAGNFNDAVKYQQQALQLPIVPSLRPGMEERLKGYRQRQPYRDTLAD